MHPMRRSFEPRVIEVIDTTRIVEPPPIGQISAISGQAAFDAIVAAIAAAKCGEVSGIVTAPINKEAMASAGIRYPGHTEILADYGGAERVAMMLANDDIRTVLVTIHTSLRKAIEQAISTRRCPPSGLPTRAGRPSASRLRGSLLRVSTRTRAKAASSATKRSGSSDRQSTAARAEGIDATGPYPGDTVFMQARKVDSMSSWPSTTIKGLIPVKYLGLEKGVNITLGLPFVRTSPDHGTAFDIAGQGIADHASLETALAYAKRLVAAQTKTN